jgi:hypothetical protein
MKYDAKIADPNVANTLNIFEKIVFSKDEYIIIKN